MIHPTGTDALVAPAPPTTLIRIDELLSTCVDACARGCTEIRAVQQARDSVETENNFSILKEEDDPKSALTQADGAAQVAILSALVQEWGLGLRIVGEEEEEASVTNVRISHSGPLRRDLCQNLQLNDNDTTDWVDIKDVTVFVDPLDGTREFVERRLSNCQSLVGIVVGDTPVAAVQGLPFPDGTLGSRPMLVYGHVRMGHGIVQGVDEVGATAFNNKTPPTEALEVAPSNDYSNIEGPLLGSGDSQHPVMVACRKLSCCNNVLYGGAGNKILAVALGHLDCSIALKYGGPWDVAAPQALLESMGGRLTTLTGAAMNVTYWGDVTPNEHCRLGFIATGPHSVTDHDMLVASLLQTQEMQDYLKINLS